jgi:hypothetical protein
MAQVIRFVTRPAVQSASTLNPDTKDLAGLETDHFARADLCFDASFGIAPNTGSLAAHREVSKPGDLDQLTAFQTENNLLKHGFKQIGTLIQRKTDFTAKGIYDLCPRQGFTHAALPSTNKIRRPNIIRAAPAYCDATLTNARGLAMGLA